MKRLSKSMKRSGILILTCLLLGFAAVGCDQVERASGGAAATSTLPTPAAPAVALPAVGLPPSATAPAGASPLPSTAFTLTTPALTPGPTLTSTPVAALRQLTSGGCCVGPSWSPDGSRVIFIDKPGPDQPSGLWGVGLEGGPPQLFTDRLGIYSTNMQFIAYPEGDQTVVERLSDGQRGVIPSQGRAVSFSPDGSWVAWTAGSSGRGQDRAPRMVWVSRSDGSDARQVITLYGGGFAGWFPDGRLLVSGRLDPQQDFPAYLSVPVDGGQPVEIARAERLRGGSLSPGGTWLAYLVAFAADPAENGLWLANTETGEKRRLDLFGAYRWRDDGRLLVVPLDLSSPVHRLIEVEAASGTARNLTDPQINPFKIANGDWSISPGGQYVAFLSALDHNIWLIELPE